MLQCTEAYIKLFSCVMNKVVNKRIVVRAQAEVHMPVRFASTDVPRPDVPYFCATPTNQPTYMQGRVDVGSCYAGTTDAALREHP